MSFQILNSNKKEIGDIIQDLKKQKTQINTTLILFFNSIITYEPSYLSDTLKNEFSDAEIIGATSVGDIQSDQSIMASITLICFDENEVKNHEVQIITNLDSKPISKLKKSVKKIDDSKLSALETIGLCFFDGLRLSERWLSTSLSEYSKTNYIGVAAGDNLEFENTFVFHNEKAYSNAAILLLIKPENGFEIEDLKQQKILQEQVDKQNSEKMVKTISESKQVSKHTKHRLNIQFSNVEHSLSKLSRKKQENSISIKEDESIFYRVNTYGNFYKKHINKSMITILLK